MPSQNPLFSYENLRTVMTFLDPLVRLKLSRQCSSLRYLHNMVPMKIQYLRITPSDFKINDTTYKIGIIRKYINGKNPINVEEENARGGFQYDTDQYGIRRDQFRGNEEIRRVLEWLRAFKDNADYPFSMYVQLLIIPDEGPRKVECLVYNKTLQEVKDSWMLKLFGTNVPIHVQNLDVGEIYQTHYFPQMSEVLKFPYFPLETSKLKVSNLNINWVIWETLNAIRPVLDGSPLKMFKTDCSRNIPNDPIIQESKFLNITGNSQFWILMRFSNERIHLEECNFTEEDVSNVAKHWKNMKETKGKHFSMGFKEGKDVVTLLNMFKGLPGAKNRVLKETRSTTFPECVILPIRENSELTVYCETPESRDADYCDTQWIARIKIQPKGFVDNLFID